MEDQDRQLLSDVLGSDNFSDQEKQIIKGRFEKAEKREAFLIKYQNGEVSPAEILSSIGELLDEQCEHGRDMTGTCSACFSLEKKVANLHPEWFNNDPSCSDLFADDEEPVN